MRPYILAETNYAYTKTNRYEVAVLPLGATEPHNLHLPYGTDVFEGTIIGEKICQAAHERGAKVILLPTIPYGTETNMHRFPLAMNVDPSTLFRFVTDLVHCCINSGVRKIVLLNSHGGNEMKPLLRELADKIDGHLFLCNWYTVLKDEYAQLMEHPRRPRGRDGDLVHPGVLSALGGANGRWQSGRRRRDDGPNAVRGGQSRLGQHHAALAPADDQQRRGLSAQGQPRKGREARGDAGRAAGKVPGRAVRSKARRAFSLLIVETTFQRPAPRRKPPIGIALARQAGAWLSILQQWPPFSGWSSFTSGAPGWSAQRILHVTRGSRWLGVCRWPLFFCIYCLN
jgi:creatinine amidohydrolase/Fe(II)-dependent formamide hydrolase-like protein